MLKPLAKKKAMVLSSPQTYLEEWQAHVQHNAGSLHSVLQQTVAQHGAAVRIQLRYKKYQEKVRLLLKKSEKAVDEQQQQDNAMTSATGSVKAALRERGVAGSSMALAVAYNVRKENGNNSSGSHDDPAQSVLVRNPKNNLQSYTSEMRSNLNDPSAKWNSTEWTIPEQNNKALHDVQAVQSAVNNDEEAESKERDDAGRANDGITTVTAEATAFPQVVIAPEQQEAKEDEEDKEATASRDHGFVDIMHHSWLLSSMEERCAVAAASVGAAKPSGKSALNVADFRHTLLDLVFIARSGVGHNFHGRAPSSVAEHHRNLISRVQRAVEESSNEALSKEDAQRVTRIFNGLKSDMLMPAVRCLGWILTKTWRMLFNGVHVDVESLHRVLSTIERLQQEDDVSVVFAPTHKTHLDYLIISYLCFAYGIPLPRIAAGNNLDLPLIGSFLRANGSFFIRRSFKNDQLYKHVLQSYVHELMADGNPIEVFVEGGRSRHGRVCKPRLGFLSMFHEYAKGQVDADADGTTKKRNVVIVPIALDYDKVYEVEEYANQLLGKPKQKESIAGFLKSVWDIFFLRCGHSYVRFGAPLSLTATSSLDDTARELAVRMQTSGTITSTAMVSALLMWKRGYQTREMLQSRVHWLVKELTARSAHLAHVADDHIADHALSVLNVDVLSNGVLVPQLEFPTRALEMGFYRNHVLHVFLPEMAIAGAIDSLLRETPAVSANTTAVTVTLEAIEEKALMMWNFLRHICRHDDVDLSACIAAFIVAQAPACRLTTMDTEAVTVDLRLWKASRLVGFVLSLHWPFVDSLWLCSQGLWSLISSENDQEEHTEREVVRRVQILARELFLHRALVHAEAFCSESIKQSLDFLVERGLIRYVSATDGRSRAIQFCKEDDRKEEFVQALVDEVNGWRRPTTRLWTKHAAAPANLTQATAMALLTSADLTNNKSSSGVYDAWMAPAVVVG